jgi:hypothetical protein
MDDSFSSIRRRLIVIWYEGRYKTSLTKFHKTKLKVDKSGGFDGHMIGPPQLIHLPKKRSSNILITIPKFRHASNMQTRANKEKDLWMCITCWSTCYVHNLEKGKTKYFEVVK